MMAVPRQLAVNSQTFTIKRTVSVLEDYYMELVLIHSDIVSLKSYVINKVKSRTSYDAEWLLPRMFKI